MPHNWPSAFDDKSRHIPNGLQLTSGQTSEQIVIIHDIVIAWHTDGLKALWQIFRRFDPAWLPEYLPLKYLKPWGRPPQTLGLAAVAPIRN